MIGMYRPGTSLLHRAPAGTKVLGLALAAALLVWLRSPLAVLIGAGLSVIVYGIARLPPTVLLAQVWPLRWMLLMLTAFQWWTAGPASALVVSGTLVVLVATAGLVTLTTRTSALLDLFERSSRGLRRFGVDPQRVSLLLALTIRAIPVLVETVRQVQDARRARGLERSPRALLVPVVIRTMRHADRLGEALVARGVDD